MFSNRTVQPKFGQVVLFGLKWCAIVTLSWSVLLLLAGRVLPLDPSRPLEMRVLLQGLLPFLSAVLDPKLWMAWVLPLIAVLAMTQWLASRSAEWPLRLASLGLFSMGLAVVGVSRLQPPRMQMLSEQDAAHAPTLISRGIAFNLSSVLFKLGEREVADDLRFRVRFRDRRRFLPGWGKISDQEQVVERVSQKEWMRFIPDRAVMGWRSGMGEPPHFEARIRDLQREKTENSEPQRSLASGPETTATVEVFWVDGQERASERELTLYPGFAQHARKVQRGLAFELVLEPAAAGRSIEVANVPFVWIVLMLLGSVLIGISGVMARRKDPHA